MSNSDEKLNDMLLKLEVPAPSPNMNSRILAEIDIAPTLDSVPFLQQVLSSFIIPKPTYVLAFSLIFGLVLGFQDFNLLITNQSSYESYQALSALILGEVDLYE